MKAYGLGLTISSASSIDAWDSLRPVAATARALLIAAAAQRWGVAATSLTAHDGRVFETSGARNASFGELAADASRRTLSAAPRLKLPEQFRLLGRDVARLDVADKISGNAKFGLDVRLHGQRYAAIVRCPQFGGRVASFEAAPVRGVAGVQAVQQLDDNTVAVVASSTYSALRGASVLGVICDAARAAVGGARAATARALTRGPPPAAL